jgi:hypothetical protein
MSRLLPDGTNSLLPIGAVGVIANAQRLADLIEAAMRLGV